MDESEIVIAAGEVELVGSLALAPEADGVVVFAHGSGSSRSSPRNRSVASSLNAAGLGTLLIDILSAGEEQLDRVTRELRFDIGLLAGRLLAATDWLTDQPETAPLRIGYFGASTGAAAALIAAAERPDTAVVVSRGGRPDLAGEALEHVRAPTLLVVGEQDPQVLELNEAALARLDTEKGLAIVPGATHLFEEPGALDDVARLASDWFTRHLGRA